MSAVYWPDRDGVVRVGNARGKVALYLDEVEAFLLADLYGDRDSCREELINAAIAAYPEESE